MAQELGENRSGSSAFMRGLSLDHLFERVYRRRRGRYVETIVAVSVLWILLVIVPLYTSLLFPYFDASGEQVIRIMAAFEIALLVAAPGMFVIAVRSLRPAVDWMRGERGKDAAVAAWVAGISRFPRMVVYVALWIGLWCIPPALYAGDLVNLSVAGELLYLLMLAILVAGAGVFAYLFFEQAMRPLQRELAAELPARLELRPRGVSLSLKVLALVPLINLYTGVIVAAVSTNSLGLEGNLAVTLAAALLVSGTVALGLTVVFRHSLLERLEELRKAMGRVEDGDYDVRLLPVGGDELDDVGRSFNEMTDRLRGHDEEMRESRARIVVAADEARRLVERDLHDGAQQYLVLLRMKLGLAERAVGGDPEKVGAMVREACQDLDQALSELRDLAHGIYPAVLESDGLPGALAEAAERAAIPAALECGGGRRYAPELEAAVYFCCLEALQNAAKHAGEGANAKVRLAQGNGALEFEVADDGRGYDADAVGPSAGLQNMADRIGALGGRLRIESRPGVGTKVTGNVPLKAFEG